MTGKKSAQAGFRLSRLISIFAPAFLIGSIAVAEGSAQTSNKVPYDRERLLKVVRLNALSTQEVIQAIEQRGVDFQTTPAIEGEFRQAGGRPELIDALRRNYRSPTVAPSTPSRPMTPSRSIPGVPAGAPLSKAEIITMLQGGLPSARVEQFVEVRGVTFSLTPGISREITAAGGNRSLLGAITEKAPTSSSTSPSGRSLTPVPPAGPDYDDLTDQAIAAMQANNASQAIRLLQQAAAMDSAKPTAYQLLGFAQLYGNQDILSAERSMRAALERGGGGAFRVYHDHDGFFTAFCQGSFFVTKTGVTFKADDGNHTFAAEDVTIKSTSINDFVGSQYGAFNVKVFEDASKKKSKTFNFAPATKKKAEASLIINLMKSY